LIQWPWRLVVFSRALSARIPEQLAHDGRVRRARKIFPRSFFNSTFNAVRPRARFCGKVGQIYIVAKKFIHDANASSCNGDLSPQSSLGEHGSGVHDAPFETPQFIKAWAWRRVPFHQRVESASFFTQGPVFCCTTQNGKRRL